jgi:hypothetical protein
MSSPVLQQDGPSQTQWVKIVSEDDRRWSALWLKLQRSFRKMPRWTRYGAITVLLAFAVAALYLSSAAESSRLQMICQHNFRAAQIQVMLDGEEVFSGSLTVAQSASKKHAAVLAKSVAAESFSKLINVPEGKHVVQVHITAPGEGFDQARSISADFTPEQENILSINATRRNVLTVTMESPAVHTSAATDSHPASRGGLTILFSILGTMLSASISFLVQEFWRSHKGRIAASR